MAIKAKRLIKEVKEFLRLARAYLKPMYRGVEKCMGALDRITLTRTSYELLLV